MFGSGQIVAGGVTITQENFVNIAPSEVAAGYIMRSLPVQHFVLTMRKSAVTII